MQVMEGSAPRRDRAWRAAGVVAVALAVTLQAERADAHPHVWIDAVATFVFEDRDLVGLHHEWVFDEFFSSFVIEEHDANGDGRFDRSELASLREGAFSNLREFDYFTHVRVDGEPLPLEVIENFSARIEDEVLIYEFSMPLPRPVDVAVKTVKTGVYDPEYYVEVLLDQHDPVRFEDMPSGMCIFDIREDTDNPIYYGMVYPLAITLNCATS